MGKLLVTAALIMAVEGTVVQGVSAQTYFVDQTHDGFLNLRSGPGMQHGVLTRLFPDDEVSFLEERGKWLRVRLGNGEVGWAHERYLVPYVSFSGTILTVQPTPDGFLNLREGPGTSHAIKERLHPGDEVAIVAREGKWIRVHRANGPIGWAHSKYLAQ